GVVILLGLGAYFTYRASRDPLGIAYEKIEEGMPTQEARTIVERNSPAGSIWESPYHLEAPGPELLIYRSDQGELIINSMNDRVVETKYIERYRVSVFDRLRRWLGW